MKKISFLALNVLLCSNISAMNDNYNPFDIPTGSQIILAPADQRQLNDRMRSFEQALTTSEEELSRILSEVETIRPALIQLIQYLLEGPQQTRTTGCCGWCSDKIGDLNNDGKIDHKDVLLFSLQKLQTVLDTGASISNTLNPNGVITTSLNVAAGLTRSVSSRLFEPTQPQEIPSSPQPPDSPQGPEAAISLTDQTLELVRSLSRISSMSSLTPATTSRRNSATENIHPGSSSSQVSPMAERSDPQNGTTSRSSSQRNSLRLNRSGSCPPPASLVRRQSTSSQQSPLTTIPEHNGSPYTRTQEPGSAPTTSNQSNKKETKTKPRTPIQGGH